MILLASPRVRRGDNFLVGGLAAMGTGLCGSVGNLAMLLSFTHGGEASTVMPLTGMFPLVTVVLAVILLRERMNWIQCAGIVAAMAALYLFNRPAADPAAAAATQPAAAAFTWNKLVSPWMAYAVVALVLWGVGGVLQKVATNHISTELSTVFFALAFIPVAAVTAMIAPITLQLTPAAWALTLAFGALIGVGTLILFAAYRGGKASVVTALYALYPAVTVLLAGPILGEKIDLAKGVAIALALVAGVALSHETQATPAAPAAPEAPAP
jgi:drug/metabolite transporter (DMT)-like permease